MVNHGEVYRSNITGDVRRSGCARIPVPRLAEREKQPPWGACFWPRSRWQSLRRHPSVFHDWLQKSWTRCEWFTIMDHTYLPLIYLSPLFIYHDNVYHQLLTMTGQVTSRLPWRTTMERMSHSTLTTTGTGHSTSGTRPQLVASTMSPYSTETVKFRSHLSSWMSILATTWMTSKSKGSIRVSTNYC